MTKTKINIVTLGCSKNLVDSEKLMGNLNTRKFSMIHNSNDQSDVAVINTCGFISAAKEESIDTILQFAEAKKRGELQKLVVMGCLSERYKEDLQQEIKEIDAIYGVNEMQEVLNDLQPDYKSDLIGERLLTTPAHYAYVKISEGCNRHCSFCAIPNIRGKHISRTIEDIMAEVDQITSKGIKEVMLIAQDLTYFGVDIYKENKLAELLDKLAAHPKLEWIRLHYTYPANFPLSVLSRMREHDKICNYIDIPLQHISDPILKSMKRGIGKQATIKLLEEIRKQVPGVAIRSSFIVGYPGETQEQFEELVEFIKDQQFDRLGVFTYSHEEGTSAGELTDDVPEKVKEQRASDLMAVQQEIAFEKNAALVGKQLNIVIDEEIDDYYIGRSAFDSPEVDQIVYIHKGEAHCKTGNFYTVEITSNDDFELYGEVVK